MKYGKVARNMPPMQDSTETPTSSEAGQPVTTPTSKPGTQPKIPPSIIVIFGITGDLAKRYLMPSLYHLFKQGLLHKQTEIVGVSRRSVYLDDLFDTVEMCVSEADNICDPVALAHMHSRTRVQQLDLADPAAYKELLRKLNEIEEQTGTCMNRLYYLSIPPDAYPQVIENMAKAGLNTSCQHGTASTRLLVEKPFGHDLESARSLIDTTASAFDEEQIFRIDHYLAKETAQNIAAFRFENPLFEAVWDARHVSGIDIVASENIGIEGRGAFYEQQGALRDFIQNHLLQLLAIATMDQPEQFSSDAVHAAKLRLLQSVRPIGADQVTAQARRGQYAGYTDEAGNPDSFVETYAAIETTIDSPRWRNVPVRIRTGKALAGKFTHITFTFTDPATTQTNNLRFNIQPDEGITISLIAKKPGFDQTLQPVTMDFSYAHNFDKPQPTAYERVLVDAVRGDRALFTGSDEVLAAWQIIDAVVKAWNASGEGLQLYQPGTPIDDL